MTGPHTDNEPRVVRFFTPVRRIPLLIGKIGQAKLPFGPYTFMQLGIGAATAILGWNTMSLWGPLVGSSVIAQLVALLLASVGAVFISASIPATKRKPHYLLADTVGALTSANTGTFNGAPIRIARPHQVTGVVLIANDASDQPNPITTTNREPIIQVQETPTQKQRPLATSASAPSFQSGLDRLLEQARGGRS